MRAKKLTVGTLALAVLASALAVVYVKHQNRKLFAELQHLQVVRDQMDVEWGQLQLEQSTWAAHGRVERTAYTRLNMSLPAIDEVVIVKP